MWRMKIPLFAAVIAAPSLAVDPSLCIAMCHKLDAAPGSHCQVGVFREGPMLFVTSPKLWGKGTLSDDLVIQQQSLTECFFASGGVRMEVDSPVDAKHVMLCRANPAMRSGYGCEAISTKESAKTGALASWKAAKEKKAAPAPIAAKK